MAQERVEVAIVGSNQTDQAFREVESNLGKLEGRLGTLNSAIAGFAGGIGAAVAENIGGMLVDAFKFVSKAAEEAALSQRKLEAVLRATGNTTGYTATQLNNLADKLARTTSFDDEAFREATATFVRFGNVGGENLERVLKLTADYAALTGTTVPAAADKFAAAFTNPADGIRRIERAFGELSPEIKASIKQLDELGDRAGVIEVLLSALEKRIGGSDASINTGVTGGMKELKKAISELAETAGNLVGSNGGALYFFAEQLRGLNAAITATPTEKLALIASLIVGGPRAGMNVLSALGSRPPAAVLPESSVPDLGGQVSAMAAGFAQDEARRSMEAVRSTLSESDRLRREYGREAERLRQIHLRGEEAALQAEYDMLFETMKRESDLRRAGMKEAEKIRQMELDGQEWLAKNVVAIVEREQRAFDEGLRALQERSFAEWVANYDRVADFGAKFFTDLLFNGRKAFDNLRSALKSFAAELVALFAKRWILNLAASATGSTALSAAAATAGQGTLAGATSSLVGSALGNFVPGFATGAEFFSSAMGSFVGPAAPGSAAALGAEFAAFMTNPATLAVLAAVVIALAVMSRRGGPKEGGSAFGTFDENGNFVPGFAPGTQNGRFFTPNGGDAGMVALTEGIGSAFAETLARLGGTGSGFGFGFGFDRDPRGSANSRVSGVVTNAAGQTIFEVINRDAGRSEEELQQALGVIGRQSLLAALQNSELPETVLAILRTVDAASAAAEEVDAVLKLADAFVQFTNSLQDVDVASVLEQAGRNAAEVFQMQGQALIDLANRSTITTQSLAALTQATGAYRLSAAQLIVGLEQARQAIDEMFGQTRRNIVMAGLDEQGRYNFLQDEASRLFAQLGTAVTADEITRLAQRINENINQAFGMLSPEDQARMRDDFLTRLDSVNASTQERLRALQQAAAEEANRQLAEVRRIMEEMALAQQAAATTQQRAADTQLDAANRTRNFNITLDLATGGYVVTDGG